MNRANVGPDSRQRQDKAAATGLSLMTLVFVLATLVALLVLAWYIFFGGPQPGAAGQTNSSPPAQQQAPPG